MNALLNQFIAVLHHLTSSGNLLLRQLGFRSHVFLVEDIDDTLDVSLFKHLDGKALAFAHGFVAADGLVYLKCHVEQLFLHFCYSLMAFLSVNYLFPQQVMRVVNSKSTQLGDVFVQPGIFLLQVVVFRIGGRKGQISVVGYFHSLQQDISFLNFQLATFVCRQSHRRHKAFQLHDEVQFHGVVVGIVAPVVTDAFEEFVLEGLEVV